MTQLVSEIVADTATPRVSELLASLRNPRPVLQVGAQAAKNRLQDHFRFLDEQPNAMGWPSLHFWRAQARGTAVAEVTQTAATLAVSDPAHPGALAHRVTGGTVTPKRGRYLAIPASAAAYRAGSPREGGGPSNLAFVFSLHPQGGYRPSLAVQEDVWKSVGKPRKDGTLRQRLVHLVGEVWYWLVRSATHAADPDALPEPGRLATAARDAMLRWLATATGARSQA